MKKPVDIYNLTDARDERESTAACIEVATAAASLNTLLDDARAIQWQSPLPFTRTVSGQPPRPVEDAALSTERLLVRAKVVAAERVLREAQHTLTDAADELLEAIQRFEER